MASIDASNVWYLISYSNITKSINETIDELSNGELKASYAMVSLGTENNNSQGTGPNNSTDLSNSSDFTSKMGSKLKSTSRKDYGNPFEKRDWGNIKNLDAKPSGIPYPCGMWVLTIDK